MSVPSQLLKHVAKQPADVPSGPHWAIVMYEAVYYNDSGYSEREGGGNTEHLVAYHLVFTDEQTWRNAIVLMAADAEKRSDRRFTFFRASGRGQLKVSVSVTVESTL